jgi:hypothetical protein
MLDKGNGLALQEKMIELKNNGKTANNKPSILNSWLIY